MKTPLLITAVLLLAAAPVLAKSPVADKDILSGVEHALSQDTSLVGHQITATVKDGVVTLQGQAADLAQRTSAVAEAEKIRGVVGVIDRMVLRSTKLSDDQIAEAIALRIENSEFTPPKDLSVECKKGVVTLRGGCADFAETHIIKDLAEDVAGVTAIVDKLLVDGGTYQGDLEIQNEVKEMFDRKRLVAPPSHQSAGRRRGRHPQRNCGQAPTKSVVPRSPCTTYRTSTAYRTICRSIQRPTSCRNPVSPCRTQNCGRMCSAN